jgi:hypothetical protein
MNSNELFNMKLHETKTIGKFDITRVPGGWIYRFFETRPTAVFVPLSNEFVERIKKEDVR